MATLNDDELEQNWEAEVVAVSDEDEVLSAGSEDEFEEDYDLEIATNKRKRGGDAQQDYDVAMDDGENDDDDDDDAADDVDEAGGAEKKQKVATDKSASKKPQPKPSKGLHKMTAAEHFKIVNDIYSKHRGGQMTSLELADGLNGTL